MCVCVFIHARTHTCTQHKNDWFPLQRLQRCGSCFVHNIEARLKVQSIPTRQGCHVSAIRANKCSSLFPPPQMEGDRGEHKRNASMWTCTHTHTRTTRAQATNTRCCDTGVWVWVCVCPSESKCSLVGWRARAPARGATSRCRLFLSLRSRIRTVLDCSPIKPTTHTLLLLLLLLHITAWYSRNQAREPLF